MIKNLLFICLTFFHLCISAQNFVATYGFADVTGTSGSSDPTSTPTVNGLTFGAFSAHGTSANPSASGRFSFTNWPLGGVNGTDDYSNFTGVLSPTVYFEVTLSVVPGYTLSLNTVTLAVRRSGTGIRTYCVRSDLDGYTNNLAVSTGTNAKLSVIPSDVFFWNFDSVSTSSDQKGSLVSCGSQFGAITNSVTFRFFAWNAESNGGSFSIDNVTFVGSATNTVTLPNPVGLSAATNEHKEIKLFPNPVNEGIIFIENTEEMYRVEVFSTTGNILISDEVNDRNNKIALNVCALEEGIYFLKIYSESTISSKKIVLLKD